MLKHFFIALILFNSFACRPNAPESSELSGNTLAKDYSGLEILSGIELKNALHEKIRIARKLNYNQVWVYLKTIDEDPADASRMLMVYSQRSLPHSNIAGSDSTEGWNREHVWPSSRGFSRTNMPAHTDLHNLRPCEVELNRLHADRMFGEAPQGQSIPGAPGIRMDKSRDTFEPADQVKGDIARILFYMDVRYQGTQAKESDLRLVESIPADIPLKGQDAQGNGYLANLSTLLRWHQNDPVDEGERRRQERVFEAQGNRNPFIDHPEFVARIYGTKTTR